MKESTEHVVSLQTAKPKTIAAVHARIPKGSVPAMFKRYLDQVYAAAKKGLIHPDGKNVFLYHWIPERPDELDVAFGVGVVETFESADGVQPTLLPTGQVATTTHRGSYSRLHFAHNAIQEWCRANGRRQTGVSWEVYGHWTNVESELRTDIFYLLEPG